jgi:hypothetical protein
MFIKHFYVDPELDLMQRSVSFHTLLQRAIEIGIYSERDYSLRPFTYCSVPFGDH